MIHTELQITHLSPSLQQLGEMPYISTHVVAMTQYLVVNLLLFRKLYDTVISNRYLRLLLNLIIQYARLSLKITGCFQAARLSLIRISSSKSSLPLCTNYYITQNLGNKFDHIKLKPQTQHTST